MIWLPIPKKSDKTTEIITQYKALQLALSFTDLTIWQKDGFKDFSKLKAAVFEENYDAFTVLDRGRFWYVVLK
ncbi:MAG: hypothetical protein FK731_11680 [Asgard group archaeon]|nr:hypothetical protein [Asgard group archaeon]